MIMHPRDLETWLVQEERAASDQRLRQVMADQVAGRG